MLIEVNSRKLNEDTIKNICDHIQNFPANILSHYTIH